MTIRCAPILLLVTIGLTGCGSAPAGRTDVQHERTETHNGPTVAGNQQTLSPKESEHLVRWFGQLKSCLANEGVKVGELHVAAKQLELAVDSTVSRHALVNRMFGCDRQMGAPPHKSSLQAFEDRLILYLPKQCLLDNKVLSSAQPQA